VEQLSRNAGVTQSFYAATDNALGSLGDALTAARGATVEGAQSVLSNDEREALALTIRGSLNSAVAAGNSMFRDQQLLGGVLETTEALNFDGASVVFQGTDAVAKTNVGGGDLVAVGVSGLDALGLGTKIFEGSSLNASLDRSTRLIDMRGGQGVSAGILRLSDGGNFIDVDLRNASTLGDVVDVLNSVKLNNRSLNLSIQPDGLTLDFQDGLPGTLAVADATGETMASDLSLLNPLGITAPPLVGTRLSPRVTEASLLSRLNGGAGIDVSAGIVIQQNDKSYEVDLSDAKTVGDVLIAINRSGADVKAELDTVSGGIAIRSLRSGVDYSIGENGGNVAERLGIRSGSGATLLTQLDRGQGVVLNSFGPDLSIIRPDGVQLDLQLEGASTIEDVLNLIRNHPLNQDTSKVIPSLNAVGNGIQLQAPPGGNPLIVQKASSGNAAEVLGLVPEGVTQAAGSTIAGIQTIRGSDFRPLEAGGTIDTLIRLEGAIRAGDTKEIGRLQSRLDVDVDRSSQARGVLVYGHKT
jgi:flagellar hook-associated protein 3 FlgL